MHIYRERNTLADVLEKDGANVMFGSWKISEHREAKCFEYVKLKKRIMLRFELFWDACSLETTAGNVLVI